MVYRKTDQPLSQAEISRRKRERMKLDPVKMEKERMRQREKYRRKMANMTVDEKSMYLKKCAEKQRNFYAKSKLVSEVAMSLPLASPNTTLPSDDLPEGPDALVPATVGIDIESSDLSVENAGEYDINIDIDKFPSEASNINSSGNDVDSDSNDSPSTKEVCQEVQEPLPILQEDAAKANVKVSQDDVPCPVTMDIDLQADLSSESFHEEPLQLHLPASPDQALVPEKVPCNIGLLPTRRSKRIPAQSQSTASSKIKSPRSTAVLPGSGSAGHTHKSAADVRAKPKVLKQKHKSKSMVTHERADRAAPRAGKNHATVGNPHGTRSRTSGKERKRYSLK